MTRVLTVALLLAACSRPTEVTVWRHLPIWDPDTMPLRVVDVHGVFGATLPSVIAWWNERVGCEVFSMAQWLGDPRVYIYRATPEDPSLTCPPRGGCAWRRRGESYARVWITHPPMLDMDFKILAHELGHVLGLGHDMESQTSIMRPIQPYEFVPTFLTRRDAAALRALYCQ